MTLLKQMKESRHDGHQDTMDERDSVDEPRLVERVGLLVNDTHHQDNHPPKNSNNNNNHHSNSNNSNSNNSSNDTMDDTTDTPLSILPATAHHHHHHKRDDISNGHIDSDSDGSTDNEHSVHLRHGPHALNTLNLNLKDDGVELDSDSNININSRDSPTIEESSSGEDIRSASDEDAHKYAVSVLLGIAYASSTIDISLFISILIYLNIKTI